MCTKTKILTEIEFYNTSYTIVKNKLKRLLENKIVKNNAELNEMIHIRLYDINKLLDSFSISIGNIKNNDIYNNRKEEIENYFDESFMYNMKSIHDNLLEELKQAENNLKT